MAAFLPSLISGAASIGTGFLSGKNQKTPETKMDKTKQKLIDQLLSSISGSGPYSDLFNVNEDTFQKSYVEPSLSRFRNQIAPSIQQSFVAGGQQGNSGLENKLMQAGIDLNSMLNQQYGSMQEAAQNRQSNIFNQVLGQGSGPQANMSSGQALANAASGYLSSGNFSDAIANLTKSNQAQQQDGFSQYLPKPRPGFTPEWTDWGVGDNRWGS